MTSGKAGQVIRTTAPPSLLSAAVALLGLAITVANSPARAQADAIIAPSLVHLRAEAANSVGTPAEGTATGFLVTEDGQVLTVNHFLSGLGDVLPETLRISARVGERGPPFDVLEVAVINALPELDLLLLKLPLRASPYTPVTLGSSRSVAIGAEIRTSGFPLSIPGIWPDEGKVRSQQGPGGSLWGTSMGFNAGQSGSPVYLEDGAVIGVVKGQLSAAPNINFFTPIDFADPLLIPVRFAALEKRLAAIPTQCRVCFSAAGNAICGPALRSCSEWSTPGQVAGADGDEGWSEPLQILQSAAAGFAECKMMWKLECQ